MLPDSTRKIPKLEGLLNDWLTEEQLDRRGSEESCNWLNFVAKEIWPYFRGAVEGDIKNDLETAINANLPSVLSSAEFTKFSLGDSPPEFGPIVAYAKTRQLHRGIELDIGFNWSCNGVIELKLLPVGVTMGITSLKLKGEISVVLRPLMDSLPVLGGLQIFLISPPELEFRFSGVLKIINCETLASILHKVISDQLSHLMVLPSRVFIHWIWGREDEVNISRLQHPTPEGIIRLGVEEARGLTGKDWSLMGKRTSDPCATIRVGARSHQTPVSKKTCDPKWGDDGYGDFFIYNLKQAVRIELHDVDTMPNGNDKLGAVRQQDGEAVRLMDVMAKPDNWWPVLDKGQPAGEVRLVAEIFQFQTLSPQLIRQPTVQARGNAKAVALLTVQVLALRGLAQGTGKGAKVKVIISGKNPEKRESKGATYLNAAENEGITNAAEVAQITRCQRIVEFLHLEKYSDAEIAHVSGLTEPQVAKIIKTKPSFDTQWQESFHVLLENPLDTKVEFELKLQGHKRMVTIARLRDPFDVSTVLDCEEMRKQTALKLDAVPFESRKSTKDSAYAKDAMLALNSDASGLDLDVVFCWSGFEAALQSRA
jgi:hypothetical protein